MSVRMGKLLYHLTELDNMVTILKYGLLSRNDMIEKGFKFVDIADPEIIQFRKEHGINDYIPFHFYPKNPFDGRVQKDNADSKFAYICITRMLAKEKDFKIIPRHPISMPQFQMLDYDIGFSQIQWDVIDDLDDRDYHDDNIRNICMAECVTNSIITVDMFQNISVTCSEDREYIENLMEKYNIKRKPFIDIRKNWFI